VFSVPRRLKSRPTSRMPGQIGPHGPESVAREDRTTENTHIRPAAEAGGYTLISTSQRPRASALNVDDESNA
jgi:hypothetical protein